MTRITPTSVVTHLGNFVDLAAPDPESLDITDIAFHLSRIYRFSGLGVSVAHHCIMGSRYFMQEGQMLLAQAFLLHDAKEAYTGDIPAPLKLLGPGIDVYSRNLRDMIFRKFLWRPLTSNERQQIKFVDYDLMIAEALEFTKWDPGVNPLLEWNFTLAGSCDAEYYRKTAVSLGIVRQ